MARGVRKSTLEKLQEELSVTQSSIQQYETALTTLKERKDNITKQIESEELKSLKSIMDESGLSIEDIKDLILSQNVTQQSA